MIIVKIHYIFTIFYRIMAKLCHGNYGMLLAELYMEVSAVVKVIPALG